MPEDQHPPTERGFSNPPRRTAAPQSTQSTHPPHTEAPKNPPTEAPIFYSPDRDTTKKRHLLPHWQQGPAHLFVTWRLADSLPAAKLRHWSEERDIWLEFHPRPWDAATEHEYHQRFSHQIERWLDQGIGSCVLQAPQIAAVVSNALHFFHGKRYELAAYVVMPNHVHVLFQPIASQRLDAIVQSWKGFTARAINKRLGKTGRLWQPDYWDRLIRSEEHYVKCLDYIRQNPAKAALNNGQYVLFDKTERGFSNPPRRTTDPPQAVPEDQHSPTERGFSNPPRRTAAPPKAMPEDQHPSA